MSSAQPLTKLTDPEEHLHRMARAGKNWVVNDRPSSLVFKPVPADKKKPSVYRGSLMNPQAAYENYVGQELPRPYGVLSITISECDRAGVEGFADPEPQNPAHAILNMTALTGNQIERVADKLATFARARGWTFKPSTPGEGVAPSSPGREPGL